MPLQFSTTGQYPALPLRLINQLLLHAFGFGVVGVVVENLVSAFRVEEDFLWGMSPPRPPVNANRVTIES